MSDLSHLQATIDAAWDDRASVSTSTIGAVRDAVAEALTLLDQGVVRVASRGADGVWTTHQWLKKAVLLSFRLNDNYLIDPEHDRQAVQHAGRAFDKVPLKTARWLEDDFRAAGFRMVPGSVVRRGSFIAKGAVLMPSFVNIGAYVGENTMIDTWATVGSCAQIGANVHISGGTGIGGVLEPLQAGPVIIEDNVFIGARSEVAEGVIVREGAVISMGVFIGASTKIIDRASGAVYRGEVPAYAVVVPGSLPDPKGGPSLSCAVIVKTVDAQTRSKTGINELLRE
ncbi:2,3,4,5-tetrahydropyridine-2,6-dicarboxylate N-succinyltransferase [Candidatus Phycosocius bacilliformis]|uniref:2,3,4,5-tetrahydropyridine-2,6-dicarboxylate N-succinyltransferase n=1 Tax=Candidatus Phycosocius bacilliformis TaxID=1445552 RepID=A0A2P2EAY6_9PROT|nr:2,3,4,5-tetrahydropyridine-2,6-dicarboxylate N-succinyltransferase [Candidatus Phycosocius bacilliformis]GBF58236.1 2,3,4,5-tetrahydropyridine-2,6-dicarboxylate N-succinyltransferase [Candidatus Phycosocius bacilliformis]